MLNFFAFKGVNMLNDKCQFLINVDWNAVKQVPLPNDTKGQLMLIDIPTYMAELQHDIYLLMHREQLKDKYFWLDDNHNFNPMQVMHRMGNIQTRYGLLVSSLSGKSILFEITENQMTYLLDSSYKKLSSHVKSYFTLLKKLSDKRIEGIAVDCSSAVPSVGKSACVIKI